MGDLFIRSEGIVPGRYDGASAGLRQSTGAPAGSETGKSAAAAGELTVDRSGLSFLRPGDGLLSPRTGEAALYLGLMVASGGKSGTDGSAQTAREGLQLLTDRLGEGVSLEQAIRELTGGSFTSLLDLEAEFGGGTARGLAQYLTALLGKSAGSDWLYTDLSNMPEELLLRMGARSAAPLTAAEGTEPQTQLPREEAARVLPEQPTVPERPVGQFGPLQATGRDLSGVLYRPETGVLTVRGGETELLGSGDPGQSLLGRATRPDRGGEPPLTIRLTDSGTVHVQNVNAAALEVDSEGGRLVSRGENALGELRLRPGAALELGGEGLTELGRLSGDRTNTVTLNGGAVRLSRGADGLGEDLTVLQQSITLLSARLHTVQTPDGEPLKPLDEAWKLLVPGWKRISAMEVDGEQVSYFCRPRETATTPDSLWLERGNPGAHGYPLHSLVLKGQNEAGEEQVRRAWLRWSEEENRFTEEELRPNPFAVTGGTEGEDWRYDGETGTLHILSHRVTGLAGGSGRDALQQPFSARVALENHLDPVELTLNGVVCETEAGRAFSLGRGNSVTLLLGGGTENRFRSGPGFAGISVGDGTDLTIDLPPEPEEIAEEPEEELPDPEPDLDLEALLSGDLSALLDMGPELLMGPTFPEEEPEEEPEEPPEEGERGPALPDGSLLAVGGSGGAGIGRDSGESWDRVSRITIRGGVITASGTGGGAGIGAGRYSLIGPISITGGTVSAEGGKGGGAGIGGALGAPAGDITIAGGVVSAAAARNAAAIGSGVESECGDIVIAAGARIVRAEGGDGAGIGAGPFGRCGEIRIDSGAELGSASVERGEREESALPTGGEEPRLPRFAMTPRILRMKGLDLSGGESPSAAAGEDDEGRLAALTQGTYNALYSQLGRLGTITRVERDRVIADLKPVRDPEAAQELLTATARAIREDEHRTAPIHSGQELEEVLRLLR